MAWVSVVALGLLLVVALGEPGYSKRAKVSPDQSDNGQGWYGLRLLQLRVARYLLICALLAPSLKDGGALGIVFAVFVAVSALLALTYLVLLVRLRRAGEWPVRPVG